MERIEDHQSIDAEGVQAADRRSPAERVESHIWRRMLAGFLVLVPLLVTFVVLRLLINFTDDLVRPTIIGRLGAESPLNFYGVGILLSVIVLYVVGVLVASRAGRAVFEWQHAVLSKVPIVRTISGVTRQATDALSTPSEHHVSRVVFIEWPRKGSRALGFVTGHLRGSDGEDRVAVYIPTVPNPTSGNLAFVPEADIIESDITMEDAMKLVFSGGIVLPDTSPAVLAGGEKEDSQDR